MIGLLIAGAVSMFLVLFGMPFAIRVLRRARIGQFIQEEIEGHAHKQGTPTMGGVVMVIGVVAGYLAAHLRIWSPEEGFSFEFLPLQPVGLLAIGVFLGMGLIGFLDDVIKHTRQRSLGLNKRAKFAGQVAVAALFAWGAQAAGVNTELSFVRPLGIALGGFFFVWVLVMLSGAANGVNLADGMDGLAAGSAALVFGAFTIIAFWQFRHPVFYNFFPTASTPLELGEIATAMVGALLGFLWWNAAPAKIFMGDVGSQAIGGLLGALALLTSTQLLLLVVGGLYVAETLSVMLQVASFKLFGRRIFLMAPIHFHYDLKGWPETTIVVRFWILAGVGVALGLGLFYTDFLVYSTIASGSEL